MPEAMDKLDIQPLEEAMIEAIWIQWRSLGSFIDSDRLASAVIDPEALLLASLTFRHHERRLWDILASWARNGSKLFSLQRVKNLLGGFPDLTKPRLKEFAYRARMEGNDFRWRSWAGDDPGSVARDQELWDAYPSAWHPSAIILRMRLGFGVGIVPDLLSFLISLRGKWANARLIAQATNYSVYSIRRVADEMASAHLIECTQAKPVQYRVKIGAWRDLLGTDGELPEWHFWYHVYSFAANLLMSSESGELGDLSPYMLSTKLRDLVEDHRYAFVLNQLEFPDPKRYAGEEFVPVFAELIVNLSAWIKSEV